MSSTLSRGKKGIIKTAQDVQDSPQREHDPPPQSNTICAVRWKVTDEELQAHSSAPTSKPGRKLNSSRQQNPRQKSLQDLRSLEECVRFINQWKEQVDRVCKCDSKDGGDAGEGSSKGAACSGQDREPLQSPRTARSLEECRRLILEWADELNSVDKLFKTKPWRDEVDGEEGSETDDPSEKDKQRIMEWALELQSVSESCGLPGEELSQMLRLLGLKKRRLMSVLPFLEFITWSLLKEDAKGTVPQLWLSAKQRTWRAGTSKYIPNSVWSWICSASVEVTLDPMTNHPWLILSEDRRKVQEGRVEEELPYSLQRFDTWPCVLGWEGFSSGRHYWEVELANNGYWRVGVTSAQAKRKGRVPMTPRHGYWSLWRSTRQFWACTKPETQLAVSLVPRKVGIYLDYEEGQVSFYNVDTKTHIFTFTDTFREKLYPLFAPLDGRTLITVSSPNTVTEF